MPCAVGVLTAARSETALTRAKLTVKAVSYGGQVEMRSQRGSFWQRIRFTIQWRRRWAEMSDKDRHAFAQRGYCPQLHGEGHDAPWVPTRDQPAPPISAIEAMAAAKGESMLVKQAIVECVEYAVQHASAQLGWQDQSTAGIAAVKRFQSAVFGSSAR